jgi:RNA polymerase sigma-70 factor (ECF subfamily)
MWLRGLRGESVQRDTVERRSGESVPPEADADAFVAALLAHQRRLFVFIGSLLPRHRDAEDVFQQTCLALWLKRDQYDATREFLPWAFGFARNEALKHAQRSRRQGFALSEQMIDSLADELVTSASQTAARLAALDGCLAKLDPRQAALVDRCYRGPESIKAIAAEMGISPAALTMRLQRIRHVLAGCVERAVEAADQS